MTREEELKEIIKKAESELLGLDAKIVEVEDPKSAEIRKSNAIHKEFNDTKHFYCDKCGESYSDKTNGHNSISCYKCKCGGSFVRKSPCVKCGKDYEFTKDFWGKPEKVVCIDCAPKKKHLIIYGRDIDKTKDTEHDIWHYSISYPWKREETTKPGGYKIRTFSDYYDIIHIVPVEYVLEYGKKNGPYDKVYFTNDIEVYQIGHLLDDVVEYAKKDTLFKFNCQTVNLVERFAIL